MLTNNYVLMEGEPGAAGGASVAAAPVAAPAAAEAAPAQSSPEPIVGAAPTGDGGAAAQQAPPAGIMEGIATQTDAIPSDAPATLGDWFEALPGAMKDNGSITKYKTPEAFLEGLSNLNKIAGQKGFEKPGADASPQQLDDYYSKIGRPANFEDYQWDAPTQDDGNGNQVPTFDIDKEAFASAQERLHGAGLTQEQFSTVMQLQAEQVSKDHADSIQAGELEKAETLGELHREWGDKFEVEMNTVLKAVDKFGVRDTLIKMGLNNSLPVIKMFHELAKQVGESAMTGDSSYTGGGFEDRIAALKATDAYTNKVHPDYHATQEKVIALYAKRYN